MCNPYTTSSFWVTAAQLAPVEAPHRSRTCDMCKLLPQAGVVVVGVHEPQGYYSNAVLFYSLRLLRVVTCRYSDSRLPAIRQSAKRVEPRADNSLKNGGKKKRKQNSSKKIYRDVEWGRQCFCCCCCWCSEYRRDATWRITIIIVR